MYNAVVYRPPDDSIGNHRSIEVEFLPVMEKLSQSLSNLPDPTPNVFLCGDFNLPHASWSEEGTRTGCAKAEQIMIQRVKQLQNDHFLDQFVTSLTHLDGGMLDLVFPTTIYF